MSFSYLYFYLSSPQAAEVEGAVFSPSVSVNQTEAFSASAAAAAPSLCVTLILKKSTPSSSAQDTDPLPISPSFLDLLCLSLFADAVASADKNAVLTRLNQTTNPGPRQSVSQMVLDVRHRYETRIILVKIQLFVSPSLEAISSAGPLLILHLC